MAKYNAHHTLNKDSQDYLKQFENQSRIIEEALELHKNKDKIMIKEVEKKLPKAQIVRVFQ